MSFCSSSSLDHYHPRPDRLRHHHDHHAVHRVHHLAVVAGDVDHRPDDGRLDLDLGPDLGDDDHLVDRVNETLGDRCHLEHLAAAAVVAAVAIVVVGVLVVVTVVVACVVVQVVDDEQLLGFVLLPPLHIVLESELELMPPSQP